MALKKILVIEDDQDVAYTCMRFLAKRHAPVHAPDCDTALTMLEPAPDLILLDLKMPGLKPADFACRVKLSLPKTHIIAMSGYLSAGVTLEIIKAKVDDFIAKPFERSDLDYLLMHHLTGEAAKENAVLAGSSIIVVDTDEEETSIISESLRYSCPRVERVDTYATALEKIGGKHHAVIVVEGPLFELYRQSPPGAIPRSSILTVLLTDRSPVDRASKELIFARPVDPFELRRTIAKTLMFMECKPGD